MNKLPPLHQLTVAASVAGVVLLVASLARAADPTTADCLTASENAIQLRGQSRFRAARSELLVCAADTCPADVRNECVRRVADINAAMPTIVFEAKDASGKDLAEVKISMDGQPLAERMAGAALSIDPGKHTFELEAAGHARMQLQLLISEGVKGRRELVVFGGPDTGEKPIPDPMIPSSAPGSPAGDSGVAVNDSGSMRRVIGWSIAGSGIVAIAVGAVGTLQRSSKLDSRDAICPSSKGCQAGDQKRIDELTSEARTASTLSVISFVTGGLLIGGGLVTVFTAPRASARAVGVTRLAILPVMSPAFQGAMVSGHVW